MIKIVTGFSEPGGSTILLANLTNAFNNAGYEAIMYGPQDYHLNLCNGAILNKQVEENFKPEDKMIAHYIHSPYRPKCERIALACHEKWWFEISKIYQYWDVAVFSHQAHREYHKDYVGEYALIPNIKENFIIKDKSKLDKIAGIIGNVEVRKQTHISIQRALNDGCTKVYIFGIKREEQYFNEYVKPLLGDTVE